MSEAPTIGHAVATVETGSMSEEEWQTWRQAERSIGSSQAAAVMSMSNYTSPLKLAKQLRGDLPWEDRNDFMRIGSTLEPLIRRHASTVLGETIEPVTWQLQHPNIRCMTASLDGWIPKSGVTVELKWGTWRQREHWETFQTTHDPRSIADTNLAGYLVQVQHGLAVTGLDRGYLVAVIGEESGLRLMCGCEPAEKDVFVLKIRRDPDFISQLEKQCQRFWERFVEGDETPAPTRLDTDPLRQLYPKHEPGKEVDLPQMGNAVDIYKALRTEAKMVKQRMDGIKAAIMAEMGNAEIANLGQHRATWKLGARGRTLRIK